MSKKIIDATLELVPSLPLKKNSDVKKTGLKVNKLLIQAKKA